MLTRHVKGTKQIDRVTGVYVANSTRTIELQGFTSTKGDQLIELQGFMQLTRHVKGTKQIDRVTGVYVATRHGGPNKFSVYANSTRKGDQTN